MAVSLLGARKRLLYFVVVVLLLLLAFGAFLHKDGVMTTKPGHPKILKAVLTGELPLPLTPENISTIPLFQVHTNLWGTLLSKKVGRGLADIVKVSEDEKEIHFRLKPEARFSDGSQIVADDVVFSINRLMSLQASGHFNAKAVIESIVAVSDQDLLMKLRFPSKALQYLLTVSETGIVPRANVDAQGNLKSLEVTSGPYFVHGEATRERVVLKKNPFYLAPQENAPDEVEVLFKRGPENMLQAATDPNVGFVEIYETATLSALPDMKKNSELAFVETRPSASTMLIADPDLLSLAERKAISALLGKSLDYTPRAGIEERSFEMLPPGTFGALNLTAPLLVDAPGALPKTVSLRLYGPPSTLSQAVVQTLESAGTKVTLVDRSEKKPAHLTILGQGMNADCPEIELHLSMLSEWAYLKSSPEEKQMVELALHTADDKARAEIVQKIGRAVIEDGRVFPLVVSSYVHVYRKGLVLPPAHADYDGDVHFSQMQMEAR